LTPSPKDIGVVDDEVAKRRCRNPGRIVLSDHAAVDLVA
jgi:hypothetical protein